MDASEKSKKLLIAGIIGCLMYVAGDFLFAATGRTQTTESIGFMVRMPAVLGCLFGVRRLRGCRPSHLCDGYEKGFGSTAAIPLIWFILVLVLSLALAAVSERISEKILKINE